MKTFFGETGFSQPCSGNDVGGLEEYIYQVSDAGSYESAFEGELYEVADELGTTEDEVLACIAGNGHFTDAKGNGWFIAKRKARVVATGHVYALMAMCMSSRCANCIVGGAWPGGYECGLLAWKREGRRIDRR